MRELDDATALRLIELAKIPPEKQEDFIRQFFFIYSVVYPDVDPFEKVSDEQWMVIRRIARTAKQLAKALNQLEPETRDVFRVWLSHRLPSLMKVIREGNKLISDFAWRGWP